LRGFVADHCTLGFGKRVETSLLYEEYTHYYNKVNPSGKMPALATFVTNMKDMHPEVIAGPRIKRKGAGGRVERINTLAGIALVDELDDADDGDDAVE